MKRERERERRGRASAQKQRERENTNLPRLPFTRARLSLSTKKERAKERKSEKLAASTVCVPSFFFPKCSRSKNARAVERLARTRNRSERREIAFGNSYLARINRVFSCYSRAVKAEESGCKLRAQQLFFF